MDPTDLEQRVASLESKVASLTEILQMNPERNAWRQVVGMFADDSEIVHLHAETRRIREEDRKSSRDVGQKTS